MKEKYIEEKYPSLGIAGKKDNMVNVCDFNGRVDIIINEMDGKSIVDFHNRTQQKLIDCAMAFSKAAPEEFAKFCYG